MRAGFLSNVGSVAAGGRADRDEQVCGREGRQQGNALLTKHKFIGLAARLTVDPWLEAR